MNEVIERMIIGGGDRREKEIVRNAVEVGRDVKSEHPVLLPLMLSVHG